MTTTDTMLITYTPVLGWSGEEWVETGDLNAYYTNGYGANLYGYIWLGTDQATVGVTGGSSRDIPFGLRAALDLAINQPAYRAKVIETAKRELAKQFSATNPNTHASL